VGMRVREYEEGGREERRKEGGPSGDWRATREGGLAHRGAGGVRGGGGGHWEVCVMVRL